MDILVVQFWNLIQPKLEALMSSIVEAGIQKYSSQVTLPTDLPSGKLLTFRDVQRKLKVSDPTLRKRLQKGEIAGRKVGSNWRITEQALAAYINDKQEPTYPFDEPNLAT